MIQNKIVVRYKDGRLMKGFTNDFMPNKEIFHLIPMGTPPGTKPLDVRVADLKAVFFVKDFGGNPQYKEKHEFDPTRPLLGRKIQVMFRDGEVMVGTTQGFQPNRPGFFVVPADAQSNIERCFVISAATKEAKFI
jgi:hypothetical protein